MPIASKEFDAEEGGEVHGERGDLLSGTSLGLRWGFHEVVNVLSSSTVVQTLLE